MATAPTFPTPRYSVGDQAWYVTTIESKDGFDCPDCLGTGQWKTVSPAGTEAPINCPRCEGRKKLVQHSYAGSASLVTIGQVRIEWPVGWGDKDPISYLSGVNGGSVYYEGRLFDDKDEAQAVADQMAAEQNASLDKNNPKRIDERRLYTYQIKDALVGEEQRKRRDAEYAYERLIGWICELDTYPIAKRLDEDGDEVGEYMSCSLNDEQLECIQNALVKFDDKARRSLVEYRRENA